MCLFFSFSPLLTRRNLPSSSPFCVIQSRNCPRFQECFPKQSKAFPRLRSTEASSLNFSSKVKAFQSAHFLRCATDGDFLSSQIAPFVPFVPPFSACFIFHRQSCLFCEQHIPLFASACSKSQTINGFAAVQQNPNAAKVPINEYFMCYLPDDFFSVTCPSNNG